MDSIGDIATMAARLPGELQRAQLQAVRRSALIVTRAIRLEIRNATGGDSRLSGVGRRGARVGARYDVKGATNPTALIRATGPLHLIEHPTGPHVIGPRVTRGRGSQKRFTGHRALRLSDGTFFARVNHPGTRAKKPFEKGYLKSRDEAGKIFDEQVQRAIVKVLR